jgi:hypothetical protein
LKQRFELVGGRDILFRFDCSCLHKDEDLAKYNHKHSIKLWGYADDYFFDVVNKKPREEQCDQCGKRFQVQWFRDGIIVEEAEKEVELS